MARRRRTRYRRRKGRWSANIQRINQSGEAEPNSTFGDFVTLAQNPAQLQTTVSQQYTAKNIEVSGQLEVINAVGTGTASVIEELTYYIMYVPEGYPLDFSLPFAHPEWIMAYKYAGQSTHTSSSAALIQPPKIRTRLSRRLNTGDSIIFMYTAQNNSSSTFNVKFQGLVRWWTKAN